MNQVKVSINGKEYFVPKGDSLLQTAIDNGIDIPHFCYHEDLPIGSSCRTCLVEDVKTGRIITSCSIKAGEGVAILTDTPKVKELRLKNLELLLAGHQKNCPRCQKGTSCRVADEIGKYGVSTV